MAQSVKKQEIWYKKDIQEILSQDAKNPPPRDAFVFTGSSIFRHWITLERDMAPLPVVNRAFGGARTWEVLHYAPRIILPLKPAGIVYYCGGNDLESGEPAADIVDRFARFCTLVHAELPHARIMFVSLNKAPQKIEKWPALDDVNRRAAAYCATDGRLEYVDINPGFLDAAGRPRRGLYISDGLHFMPEAYRIMAAEIKPALQNILKDVHEERR